MRLETALLTGREGINVHGQAISVVGDNIANSNTNGFKASRAEFEDLMSEGGNGRASETVSGGGSGVSLAGVRSLFEGGMIEPTGRNLDAGIDGGGFFIVGDTKAPSYSRAGNFAIDLNGYLVNGDGEQVLGYAPAATSLSGLSLNNINLTGASTTKASMVGNINASVAVATPPVNPQSFNEINSAAGFVSSMGVYDSLGQSHAITVAFFKTGTNTWTAQSYIDGGDVAGGTSGVPVQIGSNATLNFTSNGAIDPASAAAAAITATPAYSNGATAGNFAVDLSGFTQFSAPSNLAGVSQDGNGAGNVKEYEIRSNGELYANLDSGASQLVGTIALADFVNRDGLERAGSTSYSAGADVGKITVGAPGNGSLGRLQGNSLERSTVDMSTEFVSLVVLQRGYQANSQTIQAANELLQQTIGLVR